MLGLAGEEGSWELSPPADLPRPPSSRTFTCTAGNSQTSRCVRGSDQLPLPAHSGATTRKGPQPG